MAEQKNILMVPMEKPVEALRMASGLTLLDDAVTIAVWDELPQGAEAGEQLEALEFAEVPMVRLEGEMDRLARQILNSDVVFFV